MPEIRYAVITRVPEPGDRGNLATQLGQVFLDPQATGAGIDTPPQSLGKALGNPMLEVYVLGPVFRLGELLIVNGDGREMAGGGRKPNKWDVDAEYFDEPEPAVRRALEVSTP